MNKRMSTIAELTRSARAGGKGDHVGTYSVIRTDAGTVQVAYRGTVVAAFNSHSVVLNTRGYRTATTKNVINAALDATPYRVFQRDWHWFVRDWQIGSKSDQLFEEGMSLEVAANA